MESFPEAPCVNKTTTRLDQKFFPLQHDSRFFGRGTGQETVGAHLSVRRELSQSETKRLSLAIRLSVLFPKPSPEPETRRLLPGRAATRANPGSPHSAREAIRSEGTTALRKWACHLSQTRGDAGLSEQAEKERERENSSGMPYVGICAVSA